MKLFFKTLYAKHKDIALRILREVWLPLAAAITWGSAAWWWQGKTWFDAISTVGATFFFVFFLQGQVLRIRKNMRDEENADELKGNYADIRQVLDVIAQKFDTRASPPEATPPLEQPIQRWRTRDSAPPDVLGSHRVEYDETVMKHPLLLQAMEAVNHKLYYAGLLAAATGFESAVRATAKDMNLNGGRSLGQLTDWIGKVLDNPRITDRLRALSKLRNSLVHAEISLRNIDHAEATTIVNAFKEGIDDLETAFSDYGATAVPVSGISRG